MGRGEVRVIAGVGMRRACESGEIVALVRRAEASAGRSASALAAPVAKAAQELAEAAAAAAALGVPLLLVDPATAQAGCVTHSARALAAVGVASVAEGCALAGAGPGGRLILARIADARATCALAEGP